MTDALTIEGVRIHRNYGNNARFSAQVEVKGRYGKLELDLPAEHVQSLITVVADLLVQSTQSVADSLNRDALGLTAIEHQPDESGKLDELPIG